jgi:hypothetical protein
MSSKQADIEDPNSTFESESTISDASSSHPSDDEADRVAKWRRRYRRWNAGLSMYIVIPFVVGASVAMGMCTGYAIFDRIAGTLAKRR